MRPFTLLRRSLALRRVSTAGSMLLACTFETVLASLSARSASRSRPHPAFYSPGRARSLRVTRCQLMIPEPSVCPRTAASLQDLSILRDPSTQPDGTRKNLPLRVARSALAPHRVAIINYHCAMDQRSGSATSRLARMLITQIFHYKKRKIGR
jgi:hypothetical protein